MGPVCLILMLGAATEVATPVKEWRPVAAAEVHHPTAVVPDGARLYSGTEEGLVVIEGDRVQRLGVADGLPHRVVTHLAVDASTGDLWVATMGGLARYSAGRFDAFHQVDSGLANDVVYRVAARDGEVWAVTAAGASRYDTLRRSWELFDHTNARMHEPWCYAAVITPDTVFLGVWGGGVLERPRAGGEWRVHRDPDRQMEVDLLRDDGLVSDVVSSIAVDDGVLWAATYFGVSRYDGRHWNTWSKADSGLVSDFVNVVQAVDGAAFLGTDRGLSIFRDGRFVNFAGATWAAFAEDGTALGSGAVAGALPADHVLDVAVRGKDVYLATMGGLVHGRLDFGAAAAQGETP